MTKLEAPMGLALLICDTMIEDKNTGKKSLIGLFSRIESARFPCLHPEMTIYVSLTSGRGKYPCEVICRQADGEKPVFAVKGDIQFPSQNHVVDLVFRMHGVRFPAPGTYWVHFLADDMPIMMRPIEVRAIDRPAAPPPQPPASPA